MNDLIQTLERERDSLAERIRELERAQVALLGLLAEFCQHAVPLKDERGKLSGFTGPPDVMRRFYKALQKIPR